MIHRACLQGQVLAAGKLVQRTLAHSYHCCASCQAGALAAILATRLPARESRRALLPPLLAPVA